MDKEARNPCCCCMSVRTGAMVVAILSLIGSVIAAFSSILALVGLVGAKEVIANQREAEHAIDPDVANKIKAIPTVALVVIAVIMLCYLVVSSLLVHGIRKQKANLVLPWLIVMILYTVVTVILRLVLTFQGDVIGFPFEILVFTALNLWFFSIVYYYREAIKRGGDGRDAGKC